MVNRAPDNTTTSMLEQLPERQISEIYIDLSDTTSVVITATNVSPKFAGYGPFRNSGLTRFPNGRDVACQDFVHNLRLMSPPLLATASRG